MESFSVLHSLNPFSFSNPWSEQEEFSRPVTLPPPSPFSERCSWRSARTWEAKRDFGFSFRKSIGSCLCAYPSRSPHHDEITPKTPTFAPKTVLFLSPSLNRRDYPQLVTVGRVLIIQAVTRLAFSVISTLARSRTRTFCLNLLRPDGNYAPNFFENLGGLRCKNIGSFFYCLLSC